MMIAENHQIAYRNVASKLYNFLPEEIDLALTDFVSILDEYGYQITGPMFFSVISNPTDEVMTAELFLPIKGKHFTIPKEAEVNFHSYFLVDHMLTTRIKGDFEVEAQVKYWELMEYMNAHEKTQKTPIFVEYKKSRAGQTYTEMSVGVL